VTPSSFVTRIMGNSFVTLAAVFFDFAIVKADPCDPGGKIILNL
jgi:hypothetical protein